MRRVVPVLLCTLLLGSITSSAIAHEDWESYADEFNSISYSRNDGTLDWSGNWAEVNDDGSVVGGDVHVANDPYCADDPCLNLYASLLQLVPIAAQRSADTSVFSYVEISFDMRRRFPVLVVGPTLKVKVSTNGGGSWSTIASFPLNVNDGSVQHMTYTGGWVSESFMLKFEGSGLVNGEVFIDNVVVTGEPAATGTTTTTTTTTTTQPTTTTTQATTTSTAATTTTSRPRTTTTAPPPGGSSSTSSTTVPGVVTTTTPGSSTTSTGASTSTTTEDDDSGGPVGPTGPGSGGPRSPGSGGGPGGGGGLRDTAAGIQGSFQGSLFGEIGPMADSLDPTEVGIDYTIAAEIIEASWAWMLLLGALIAWSLVTGLDRRRRPPTARLLETGE